jgi:hypothetical protein
MTTLTLPRNSIELEAAVAIASRAMGVRRSSWVAFAVFCGALLPHAAPHAAAPPSRAAPAQTPPSAADPPAGAGDVPLAADAGTYFSFFARSGVAAALGNQVRQLFHADLFEPGNLARIGIDPQRPVVHSSTIVEPVYLQQQLACLEKPPSFVIRSLLVVPVLDPARAEAALDEVLSKTACTRRHDPPARRTAWIDQLRDPEDRRAAETSDAAYLCVEEEGRWAGVVRLNPARRELRWVIATGDGSLLAAASAAVPLAKDLNDRLQRDGFFSAAQALFKTPGGDARAVAALGLNKTRAGLAGITADQRPRLWRKGAQEMGAPQRLVESPPVLFSGFMADDRALTWTLTAEGRRFFSSLALRRGATTKLLKEAIAKKLKPGGVFSDVAQLSDAIHEAGNLGSLLVRHELWPHAIAFAAAHPGAQTLDLTEFNDEAAQVEVDLDAGRVRVRPSGRR